jgi:hypothetical protein
MAEYGDSDDDRPVVRLSGLLRAYPGCNGGPGYNYEAVYRRSPEVAMYVACSSRPSGATAVAAFTAPPLHCSSSKDVAVTELCFCDVCRFLAKADGLGLTMSLFNTVRRQCSIPHSAAV